MALKLTVDKLDDIPEAVRPLYKADGDKFRLEVEGVEDVGGLKAALAAERAKADALEKESKRLKKLGKTPEEIEAALAELDGIKGDKLKAAGDFDALLKQNLDKFAAKEAELTGQNEGLKKRLRELAVDNQLKAALLKAGVTPEGLDLIPLKAANRVNVEFKDGAEAIEIAGEDGKPMAGSASGRATLDDLVGEYVAKFPSLFKGSGAGGGGMHPSGGHGAGSAGQRSKMTAAEKGAYIKEHGREAYLKLPN